MNKKLKFAVIIPVHKDPYMKGYARPEHLLSMIIDRIGSRSASTKCETPESQPVVLIHAPEDDSMPINMRASEIAGTSIYGPVIAVGPEQLDLIRHAEKAGDCRRGDGFGDLREVHRRIHGSPAERFLPGVLRGGQADLAQSFVFGFGSLHIVSPSLFQTQRYPRQPRTE